MEEQLAASSDRTQCNWWGLESERDYTIDALQHLEIGETLKHNGADCLLVFEYCS